MPEGAASAEAYTHVARAIRFLRAHAREQPDLARVAAAVGLSPWHLQRLFATWAGLSPKRFLQVMTRDHARRCLAESRDVLSAALESGLSGPGRLHDLLLACDAVTPGQLGARGEGLRIRHGVAATPFGPALIGESGRGVCHLEFLDAAVPDDQGAARLRALWPEADLCADPAAIEVLSARIFTLAAGARQPLRLLLRGTNFQVKVWEALLAVPEGRLTTYGDLAAALGQPGAARAVGRAVGSNVLALLIPCHRVIREGGELGGYRWGLERKQAILAWESRAAGHGA